MIGCYTLLQSFVLPALCQYGFWLFRKSQFETIWLLNILAENFGRWWGTYEWRFLLKNECSFSGGDTQTLLAVKTRIHSSRMHTVRCSGRWGVSQHALGRQGGVCSGSVFSVGCLPTGSALGGFCTGGLPDTPVPPLNRMTDRCLWKYYLAATSLPTVKIELYALSGNGNAKTSGTSLYTRALTLQH